MFDFFSEAVIGCESCCQQQPETGRKCSQCQSTAQKRIEFYSHGMMKYLQQYSFALQSNDTVISWRCVQRLNDLLKRLNILEDKRSMK
jgi:hypothetical protein